MHQPAPPLPAGQSTWIDLLGASATDIRIVEETTGLQIPTEAELAEIESSSRLYLEGEALYMSMPAVLPPAGEQPRSSPLGFVLTPQRLLTVRFAHMPTLDAAVARCRQAEAEGQGSAGILATLLEGIIDRLADVLERAAEQLDRVSHRIFHDPTMDKPNPRRETVQLRATLGSIGRTGELVAKLRDSLLGLGRILPFVAVNARAWLPSDIRPRLKTMRNDVRSLNAFADQISNQVTFLLDATLGFINIAQNNIIKVLTVVSVVGVPPTLVASIYGMNFHQMPELSWTYGYPYGLTLILLSALVPLWWFRRRGWL